MNQTARPSNRRFMTRSARAVQKGFTIVELIVVITIGAILALLAVPAIQDFIIEGRVEPTAADITKTVTKIRGNSQGNGALPYANLAANGTAVFANAARSLSTALQVTGAGNAATVTHDIGEAGAQITVAPANLGAGAGDSFAVTVPNASDAACPGLANQVSRSAETITINGNAVKAVGAAYQGAAAQNFCTEGDTNTFVFTFR